VANHSGKIFPTPTRETAHYWEGCREHKLRLQCCVSCGKHQFYPRSVCSHCLGDQLRWIEASGAGKVISFTLVRRAVSEAYKADTPYVVALVQLDEGPTMMSNVERCTPESVEIGMRVTAFFEEWSEEISIPKFCPI
jgi:uncharacterized protein